MDIDLAHVTSRVDDSQGRLSKRGRQNGSNRFRALMIDNANNGARREFLGSPSDALVCGDTVFVRASAGLIELPVMNGGFLGARRYAYGSLTSDLPAAQMNSITSDYNVVRFEPFRSVIREALRTR